MELDLILRILLVLGLVLFCLNGLLGLLITAREQLQFRRFRAELTAMKHDFISRCTVWRRHDLLGAPGVLFARDGHIGVVFGPAQNRIDVPLRDVRGSAVPAGFRRWLVYTSRAIMIQTPEGDPLVLGFSSSSVAERWRKILLGGGPTRDGG